MGLDPAWVSVIVGIVSSLISAVIFGSIAFAALKSWMARREAKEEANERRLANAEADIEVHSLGLQKLDVRVSVLEDRSPRRQPKEFSPA
jgi:hypothetical protein